MEGIQTISARGVRKESMYGIVKYSDMVKRHGIKKNDVRQKTANQGFAVSNRYRF